MDIFSDNNNKHRNRDTVKETEIRDGFDRLRFRISFVQECNRYMVRISSFTHGAAGTVVLEKFFNTKTAAQHFYEKTLIDYGTVVDADCNGHQSVKDFEKRINYKKTTSKCCSTCKWSRMTGAHENIFNDDCPGSRLVCCNSELFNPKRPHCPSVGKDLCGPVDHGHCHDRPGFRIDLQPAVDPMGICDAYAPRKLPDGMNVNCHGEWTWDHHDCAPGHVTESVIKFEINQAMGHVENRLNQSIEKKFDDKAGELVDEKVETAEERLNSSFDGKITAATMKLSADFDTKLDNTRLDYIRKMKCLDNKFENELKNAKINILREVEISADELQHQMHQLNAKTDCKIKCLKTQVECDVSRLKIALSSRIDELETTIGSTSTNLDTKIKNTVTDYIKTNGDEIVKNAILGDSDPADPENPGMQTETQKAIQQIVTNTISEVIAVQDGGGANGYEDDGYNKDYNGDGQIEDVGQELNGGGA